MLKNSTISFLALSCTIACGTSDSDNKDNVETSVSESQPDSEGDAATESTDAGAHTDARGFVVVHSDYQSANVSIIDLDGKVTNKSLVSSGSEAPGLSAALSGDVVPPSSRLSGDELVLIDRTNSVLTWINHDSGEVREQLNVGPGGFNANPHDYVPYETKKAFVVRYAANEKSGEEKYDSGNDVLVINPKAGKITGSIDLKQTLKGEDDEFLPRGDRALMAGGKLRVLVLGQTADFSDQVDSRIVTIDPEEEEVESTFVFDGMHSCSSMALSPDGTQLAIACNGAFGQDAEDGFPDSGIVLLEVDDKLGELDRFEAKDLGKSQINQLDYVDEDNLVFTTFGRFDENSKPEAEDTVRQLDISKGKLVGKPLAETDGAPFNIGAVVCSAADATCVVADAASDGGVLRFFEADEEGMLKETDVIKVKDGIGLPPRYLGLY